MDLIGFVKGLSNDAYHSGPGISKSNLSLILRSPAHYKAKEEQKDTPALLFGTAFHEFMLEPKSFEEDWHVTTKKTISKGQLPEDALTKIKGMKQAIFANETAYMMFAGQLEYELSLYWKDPIFNVLCKSRMDIFNTSGGNVVDIKTCQDARPEAIRRDAYKFGWHMQAGWYLYGLSVATGVEHKLFYFIAVEKEPPHAVAVYQASEEMIQEGMVQCQRALEVYAECLKKDEWPGYQQDVVSLELPSWIRKKNMMDEYAIIE